MTKSPQLYEDYLSVIVNTRLLYNTMSEIEQALDNNSIHSNGIKRSFAGPQKLRSAYRDLKGEVEVMTNGQIHLTELLEQYRKAWQFYKDHFMRKSNREQLARELLAYCYPPYCCDNLLPRKAELYRQVVDEAVNVPLLVLLILKIFPGYDSRMGDARQLPEQFTDVIGLLESFIENTNGFSVLPAVELARAESRKTRLMLYYHMCSILDAYANFADNLNRYDMATNVKRHTVSLNLAGFWNECGGDLTYTEFWQVEEAINNGTYFMTHWAKDAENHLTGIRYTLFVAQNDHATLTFYLLHPQYILRRIKNEKYTDSDQVCYSVACSDAQPNVLNMHRSIPSHVWPQQIQLTRCTDPGVVSQYDDYWMHKGCTIVKPYEHLEYTFRTCLYAITPTHLYIEADTEGEYYQIPKAACEGLECITLDDNVGTMTMNGQTYLVFDELLLFISADPDTLRQYGISRVRTIV